MKFEEEKEKEEIEEVSEEKENDSTPADRFTQLMFGNRVPPRYRNQQTPQEKEKEKLEEVNYFTLMEQIDDIMVSLENLKPVLKEFSPIMDFFKKKS